MPSFETTKVEFARENAFLPYRSGDSEEKGINILRIDPDQFIQQNTALEIHGFIVNSSNLKL
jgi:hypothetical protein